jgi:serine/threonine protein kinase
MLLRHLNI